MEKNYEVNQNDPEIMSLEKRLRKKAKPQKKSPLHHIIYPIYQEDSLDIALRTGFDPLTKAWVERKYLNELHEMGAWAFYEPQRHTYTLPYAHELGGKKAELRNYANHERAHALGSVNEPNTEAYARDILDKVT